MKLSLHITKEAGGWAIGYLYNGNINENLPVRQLRRIGETAGGFPLPPSEEAACWAGESHENLCAPPEADVIEKLLGKVINTDPQAADIKSLGNYLSAVLFGPHWAQVSSLAEPHETIELELFLAPGDAELQRLPWEMMYDAKVPFAALQERDVAITRIIAAGKERTGLKTINLTLPLKVLFVIGQKLDKTLRPGAEYIGLLRQMKITSNENGRNRHLNSRILTEATLDELKEAVAEFQPSVVHFIAHGDERGRLLLSKRDDQTHQLAEEPDYCDAEKLLTALRANEPPHAVPPVVVLNACHTSDANVQTDDSQYRSTAAQLVEGGVSVAVGMTGEVADGACRLFTRRFYQALMTENEIDISVSTSRGRRAAMLFYVSDAEKFYENHIEWARPTLFLEDRVEFILKADEAACVRAEAPQKFVPEGTSFCDRLSYLQHFQKFTGKDPAAQNGKMLLFSVNVPDNNTEQYGKTRLLRELAGLTLLNGLIPCPVFSGRNFEPPPNLLSFALTLAEAMDDTRAKLGIDKKKNSFALVVAAKTFGTPKPDVSQGFDFTTLKSDLEQNARLPAAAGQTSRLSTEYIRSAILEDFKSLRQDLSELQLSAPIIVLIDDLHRYDGVTGDFLNETFFNEYGLGDKDTHVRVIATYSTKGEQSNARRDIEDFIKAVNSRVYARKAIELKPIEDVEEARMAYTQHLLTLQEPLAVNTQRGKQQDINTLFKTFHNNIKGVPSLFNDPKLAPLLQFAVDSSCLITANDEKIYESLSKNGGNV